MQILKIFMGGLRIPDQDFLENCRDILLTPLVGSVPCCAGQNPDNEEKEGGWCAEAGPVQCQHHPSRPPWSRSPPRGRHHSILQPRHHNLPSFRRTRIQGVSGYIYFPFGSFFQIHKCVTCILYEEISKK